MVGVEEVAMYADKNLLKKTTKAAGNVRSRTKTEEALFSARVEYMAACELSRGSDPGRSGHWEKKAITRQAHLRELVHGEN